MALQIKWIKKVREPTFSKRSVVRSSFSLWLFNWMKHETKYTVLICIIIYNCSMKQWFMRLYVRNLWTQACSYLGLTWWIRADFIKRSSFWLWLFKYHINQSDTISSTKSLRDYEATIWQKKSEVKTTRPGDSPFPRRRQTATCISSSPPLVHLRCNHQQLRRHVLNIAWLTLKILHCDYIINDQLTESTTQTQVNLPAAAKQLLAYHWCHLGWR